MRAIDIALAEITEASIKTARARAGAIEEGLDETYNRSADWAPEHDRARWRALASKRAKELRAAADEMENDR